MCLCFCVDEDVYNSLYTACKTGNASAIQRILDDLEVPCTSAETADAGEIPVDARNGGKIQSAVSRLLCHRSRNSGTTLLHVASQCSHVTVVRLLLQHGADPSIK